MRLEGKSPAVLEEEEESLRDKIRADHERALQEAKEKLRKSREELQAEIQTEKNKVMEDLKKKDTGPKPLPPVPMPKVVGVSDGEPPEPDVKEKRDKIREMMKHAWDSYRQYGWGHNELKPLAKKGHSTNIFGNSQPGQIHCDALGTLLHQGVCMRSSRMARSGSTESGLQKCAESPFTVEPEQRGALD
ncbi:mannosyl-oligosaccharide 1,2-alpha-mannosidase IB [Lates japonicus]|uniref:alpha-1,2-Mannosidase n=1 Tax=Lates japonicus TaxID=270547 RepID=A0AAD3R5Y3_LATJO|nr:mannosyl-oligosaccharide 1,2-alpha-mannosidase IB [Lates japonicus]